ncbi:MAG: tyrosine-type recombinase/integrase [Lachnospiraceae bacterium]|nr:tyrosine-type recombinase/integrase [Lachnospiraceae bacterium]
MEEKIVRKESLLGMIEEYKKYLLDMELSEGTITKYEFDVKQFLASLCDEITHENVKCYKNLLMSKYKISTVNSKLISINKFLTWSGNTDLCVKIIKVQRTTCIDNVLSKEEYLRMIEFAKSNGKWKIYYIMRTLALTGVRVGELQYFTVEAVKNGKIEIFNKGKLRSIYLSNKVRDVLEAYCNKHDIYTGTIFRGNNLKPISPKTIWRDIKIIAIKAHVSTERAYPHSFRHLFAKEYMKASGDITELADILGHSRIDTTWRYTKTSAEEKIKVLDKVDL